MNKKVLPILKSVILSGVLVIAASCKKNSDPAPSSHDADTRIYHVALAVDPDDQSSTFFQQISDFSSAGPDIDFSTAGFQLASTRTARPYSSPNGQYIFSYDYSGGQVYSYKANSGGTSNYTLVDQVNPTAAIGSNVARFTKVSNDACLLHIVNTSPATAEGVVRDDNGTFLRIKNKVSFIKITTDPSTGSVSMGSPVVYDDLLLNAEEAQSGVYISRIDAPVVANGKVYYGFARSKRDTSDLGGANVSSYKPANASVFVMDYPSFANPVVIYSNKAQGNTNGYRTPTAHVNEEGDAYQLVSVNGKDTKILKLRNGSFDANYEFNLSSLIGKNTYADGWFYVGNGIGYIPFLDTDLGTTSTNNYSLARIDLKNNTAVVMNLPANLWFRQYQNSVVADGKFVMAVVPSGADGNFYLFDPSSTSPNAFEVGAKIKNRGAGTAYIGVF
ncbi:MAG: hypothetical protein NVV82_29655 [Sporocytophaga sp.]|nr:hypothetical protein [Sporocytophaga sp.]